MRSEDKSILKSFLLFSTMLFLTRLARSSDPTSVSSVDIEQTFNETIFYGVLSALVGSFKVLGQSMNMTAIKNSYDDCMLNSYSDFSSSGSSSWSFPNNGGTFNATCPGEVTFNALMSHALTPREKVWTQGQARKTYSMRGSYGEDGPKVYYIFNEFMRGLQRTYLHQKKISDCSIRAKRGEGARLVFSGYSPLMPGLNYSYYPDPKNDGTFCLGAQPEDWNLGPLSNITENMIFKAVEAAQYVGNKPGEIADNSDLSKARPTRSPTFNPTASKSLVDGNKTNSSSALYSIQKNSPGLVEGFLTKYWPILAGGGGALVVIAVVLGVYRRRAHKAAARRSMVTGQQRSSPRSSTPPRRDVFGPAVGQVRHLGTPPRSEDQPEHLGTPERWHLGTPQSTPQQVGEHLLGGSPAMDGVADAEEEVESLAVVAGVADAEEETGHEEAENLAEFAAATALIVGEGIEAWKEEITAAQAKGRAEARSQLDALTAKLEELQQLSPEPEVEAARADAVAARAEAVAVRALAATLLSPRSKIEQKNLESIDLNDIEEIGKQSDVYESDKCYLVLLGRAISENKVERLYLLINSDHQPSQEPEPEPEPAAAQPEPEPELRSELDEVKNKLDELVRMVELSKLILKKVLKSEDSQDFFKFLDNIIENAQKIQEGVKGREREAAEAQQELGSDKKNSVNDDTFCRAIREAVVEAKERLEKERRGQSFSNEPQKEIITLILAKFDLPTPKAETTRKLNRERFLSSPGFEDFRVSGIVKKNEQWLAENIKILKENKKINEEEESSLWASFNEPDGGDFAQLKSDILRRLESLYDEKMKPLEKMRDDLESFKNKLLEYGLPTESGQQDVKAFNNNFSELNGEIKEQEGGKQTLELIDNAGKSFAQLKLDIIEGYIKALVDHFTTELSEMSLGSNSIEELSKEIGELREMTEGGQDFLTDVLVAARKINEKIKVEEEQEKAIKSLREQLTKFLEKQVRQVFVSVETKHRDARVVFAGTAQGATKTVFGLFLGSVSAVMGEQQATKLICERLNAKSVKSIVSPLEKFAALVGFCEEKETQIPGEVLEKFGITAAKKTHDLLSKFTGNILSDDTAYQSFMAAIIGVDEAGISVPKNREEKLAELAQQIGFCGESQSQPEPAPACKMSP